MKILLGIVIFGLAMIMYGYFENFRFKVTEYRIDSMDIPDSLKGKKCVCFSDLHDNSYMKDNNKIIRKIEEIRPDFIIIAGDSVSGTQSSERALELLRILAGKYTVIAANGNHELEQQNYSLEKYELYCNTGIINLDNEHCRLYEKCIVYGLNIDDAFYGRFRQAEFKQDYITKKLGILDNECYNILVAHNPAYIPNYVAEGYNLVLCGHFHGGFIRIPFIGGIISPQLKLFPKYSGGHYKIGRSDVIVSRGIGSHTIPLRINNTPELIVIMF